MEQVDAAVKAAVELGYKVTLFFIVGSPEKQSRM